MFVFKGFLIEHRFSKPRVTGSNPLGRAKKTLVLNPHFRCCIKDSINIYFYPFFVMVSLWFGHIYKEQSLLISQYYFHTSWYEIHPFTPFDMLRWTLEGSLIVSHGGPALQRPSVVASLVVVPPKEAHSSSNF